MSKPSSSAQAEVGQLLPVFVRKEQTTDPYAKFNGLHDKMDTVIYRDAECKHVFVRYPWYRSDAPRRGKKRITLNCWPWDLQWLAAAKPV